MNQTRGHKLVPLHTGLGFGAEDIVKKSMDVAKAAHAEQQIRLQSTLNSTLPHTRDLRSSKQAQVTTSRALDLLDRLRFEAEEPTASISKILETPTEPARTRWFDNFTTKLQICFLNLCLSISILALSSAALVNYVSSMNTILFCGGSGLIIVYFVTWAVSGSTIGGWILKDPNKHN